VKSWQHGLFILESRTILFFRRPLRILGGSAEAATIREDSVQPSIVISAHPLASTAADQAPTVQSDLTGVWATPGGSQFLQAFQTAKRGRRQYPMKATDLYIRGVRLGDDALGFLQKNPLAFQMARSMMQAEARSLVRAAK